MDQGHNKLRRGWTTGACAAAAAKAACTALITGRFPDPVTITLPGGQQPAFALARYDLTDNVATVAIVKDAGDDPDVTHGAVIVVQLSHGTPGQGIKLHAGPGVGMVTLQGLPIEPGQAAINPVPRKMIMQAITEVAHAAGQATGISSGISTDADANSAKPSLDFDIKISVPGGELLAKQTLNPRLGIIGGISILGTTGIVIPFSCAAWINSIHRGIDVAIAAGHTHIAGSTGSTSERAVQQHHVMAEQQLIEMGDFIGGMLKYLKKHPVDRVTIAGGVAKMTKLAQGMLDVHSKRGSADFAALAHLAETQDASKRLVAKIQQSNTVAQSFDHARDEGFSLGEIIAANAWQTAAALLSDCQIELEILIFDRDGALRGTKSFAPTYSVEQNE